MKKNQISVVLCAVVFVLLLGATACGDRCEDAKTVMERVELAFRAADTAVGVLCPAEKALAPSPECMDAQERLGQIEAALAVAHRVVDAFCPDDQTSFAPGTPMTEDEGTPMTEDEADWALDKLEDDFPPR